MGIAVNDFLLISDCAQVDLVQACLVTDNSPASNSTITLSTACTPGNVASSTISSETDDASKIWAEVIKLQGTLYYVGKRGGTATNPPALFRRQLSATGTAGTAEDLSEGV